MAAAALVVMPLGALVVLAVSPTDDIWSHLVETVLARYVRTTLLLAAGVGVGTLAIGVGTAWLVTMYRFPGRRLFDWALLLPLAVPAYVIAYVYTDLLEFAGPVQGALRATFGWTRYGDYWFPEIRSLGGAVAMMTLVLYPYVYLLARAAFLSQSACVLEVGRTLGLGPWRSFFRIGMPLARPALVVGVSLVMMETLNDFGTVDYFAVATFTAGIYDVWLNMNSTAGAAQLSIVLLGFVFVLVSAERVARKRQRFHQTSSRWRALPSPRLTGGAARAATFVCALPVIFGFGVPAGLLAWYAIRTPLGDLATNVVGFAVNSLVLSGTSAAIAVALAVVLAYGMRLHASRGVRTAVAVAGFGYAVPGAVLAVGVLVPLAALDNTLDAASRDLLGVSTGLLLSGTIAALVYGYTVRFLTLSLGTTQAGLARVTPNLEGAARSLGRGAGGTLRDVHLPMIRGSLLTAAILVFVDGMKELPITMLLRPFNFDTLATFVHQYASSELLAECSAGALAIVAAGILPVIALSRTIARSRPGASG
jgi:iron(III) transport system permease protein